MDTIYLARGKSPVKQSQATQRAIGTNHLQFAKVTDFLLSTDFFSFYQMVQ